MTVGPISQSGYYYNIYASGNATSANPISDSVQTNAAQKAEQADSGIKAPGRKSSPQECQTCKERKYQDGSDEAVSFKSASHIAPEAAASAVRAHEGEHVSNAYSKASKRNGEVVSATVSIHTAICPECGRTYVSGGTTNTSIRYPNESNPYQQNRKAQDAILLAGANLNYAV